MILNNIKWKIVYSPLPNGIWGNRDLNEHIIRIDSTLGPFEKRKSLIHEIMHAYIYSFGFKLETEEAICEFVAMNLDTITKLAKENL